MRPMLQGLNDPPKLTWKPYTQFLHCWLVGERYLQVTHFYRPSTLFCHVRKFRTKVNPANCLMWN